MESDNAARKVASTPRHANVENVLRRLEAFRTARGHLYVPQQYRCPDGFRLGVWVASRRDEYKHGRLHPRYEVLTNLEGWDWQTRNGLLIDGLQRLEVYVQTYGTADVPYNYVCDDGYKLGYWVKNRHQLLWKQPWLAEILLAMPGWRTTRRTRMKPRQRAGGRSGRKREQVCIAGERLSRNDLGLLHLWDYVREHGVARMPTTYTTPDGFRLGVWVRSRRSQRGQNPVLDAQLESLLGWTWNSRDLAFEEQLQRFATAKAEGRVNGDLQLRRWLMYQSRVAADGTLSEGRLEQLRKAGVLDFAPARLYGQTHVH